MEKKYSQSKYEYIDDYKKKNYSMFSAQLKKEEYADIKELLRLKNMTNADFIRYAYEMLKSGRI